MLNPDFRDMLSALNDAGVEYLLVGAYALAAHGYPRATGDIDLWVRPTPDNAGRVWAALQAFKALRSQVTEADFAQPDIVFQIGVAPRRIDLLTSISAVRFDDAWLRRRTIQVDGLPLHTLSREDLIANKRATGRPKDLADVAWLEASEE
ncbi:MAG: nucleotidyltransferase, partial [Thermoguttaceae bacterium]